MRKKTFFTLTGVLFFLAVLTAGAAFADGLRINEVLSANSSVSPLNDEYYDMIELYNEGPNKVNLSDYALSDEPDLLMEFILPDKVLKSGEYYVIYCTGEGKKNRCNFKISKKGEVIFLTRVADGILLQSLSVPQMPRDVSYGYMDDCWQYFEKPTFGKQNKNGCLRICTAPEASVSSGCYSEPFTVSLSGRYPVYYTLDGSNPVDKGVLYTEPLLISESTNLRFCCKQEGCISSTAITCHYLMDTEKYELPIVSISTIPGTVTGSSGLWKRYKARYMEAAVSISYFVDGKEQFTIDCGLTLHGQGSRSLKKKSFNIRFRNRYGSDSLVVPLFGEKYATYNSLVLRGGSEDYNRAMLRDEFLTALTAETMPNVLYQKEQPVDLFIDGEYYGIYYIRERIDAQYVANRLGTNPLYVEIVNGWHVNQLGNTGLTDFNKLLKYCKKHDLSKDENAEHVLSQIDAESFIDYTIARAYSGDRDYPNIRHVRALDGDKKWRIVNFDLDWAFGENPANMMTILGKEKGTTSLNNLIVYNLLDNSAFREQFLTRLSYHMTVTYETSRVLRILEEHVSAIEHDMPYDRERWGLSMEKWESSVQFLRDFISDRNIVFLESAVRALHITDEELERYFPDFIDDLEAF